MKRVIFVLGILFYITSSAQQVTTKLKTYSFDFSNDKNGINNISNKIGGTSGAICSTILYSVNGVEHIVAVPLDTNQNSTLHFININGEWKFKEYCKDVLLDGARNYSFMDTLGNFAYANHGSELKQPWPLGEIVVVNTHDSVINMRKISTDKAFFHSVATGDLNNDGLIDVVGMHMGTQSMRDGNHNYWWGVENMIPYTQNNDGTFSENQDIISNPTNDGTWPGNHGAGAILLADIMGDKRPELIKADYSINPYSPSARYSFAIFEYKNAIGKYQFVKTAPLGVFSQNQGATSIKAADLNNDKLLDLIIATEGGGDTSARTGYIQTWINQGNGNFTPDQSFKIDFWTYLAFREFEVADIDNDGWNDIIIHASGADNTLRNQLSSKKGWYFQLNYLLLKNNKGIFSRITNDLSTFDPKNENYISNNNFLKGFYTNGKLKFIGFGSNCNLTKGCVLNDTSLNRSIFLYEIEVIFCKNLIKPTFNSSKFSFCPSDSLKITVSNINKGDTLKWYYGTKSDLTNVSNKTFTDSTKLFVTRTDSLGCVISSDTIQIKKYAIPTAPSLTRDTANYLLSGASGTTWYKDGTALSDTAKKYKPTTPGSYTAKTTLNGCTSVMSAAYYYLVTDIINLSKDEYIKIAPNPFINQLNFDFVVKGYQRLNIEVFDVATGNKVASQPNLTAGSRITLGQLAGGTYIIRVISIDNKIVQQFKVVKM